MAHIEKYSINSINKSMMKLIWVFFIYLSANLHFSPAEAQTSHKDLIDQASRCYLSKDYAGALDYLQQIPLSRLSSSEAMMSASVYSFYNKDTDVVLVLNHALNLEPYFAEALEIRAIHLKKLKLYEAAVNDYSTLIQHGVSDTRFITYISDQDDFLVGLTSTSGNIGKYYLERARLYMLLKRYDAAHEDVDYALIYQPENAAAMLLKSEILKMEGNRAESMEWLEKARAKSPHDHAMLLSTYQAGFKDAVFTSANLYLSDEIIQLISMSISKGDLEIANYILQQDAINDEEDALWLELQSRYLMAKSAYTQALPLLAKARRLKPDRGELIYLQATSAFYSGKFEEAARYYREYLRLYPEHANSWYNLSVVLFNQKQFTSACEAQSIALTLGYPVPDELRIKCKQP